MPEFFFAATIIAQRYDGINIQTQYTVITFFAPTKAAAIGTALEFAKNTKYPQAQGYYAHDAIVTQPSAEHLLQGLIGYTQAGITPKIDA